MASAKFLEDALSTDVDESAVNAIVGSLENQLTTTSSSSFSQSNTGIINQSRISNVSTCGSAITGVSKYDADPSNCKELNSGTLVTQPTNKTITMQPPLVIKQGTTSAQVGIQPGMVTVPMSVNSSMSTSIPMNLNKQGGQNVVASTQNMGGSAQSIIPNVQILNMRPGTPGVAAQKSVATVSPRVVIGAPQVVGARAAAPGITLQTLQGLQPGQQGHLLLKTENGQYQLLRVGPAPAPSSLTAPQAQTIRLSTVPAHAGVVTVSTSMSAPAQMQPQMQPAPIAAPVVASSVAPAPPLSQPPNVTTQKPSDNTKEKCRNFLANLLDLSSKEPKSVERNVRNLIQELIDAQVEPEEFCDRLEKLLNASPQPCLIGFLKKSLPLLRQSLVTKELIIEGINPPSPHIAFSTVPAPTHSSMGSSNMQMCSEGSGFSNNSTFSTSLMQPVHPVSLAAPTLVQNQPGKSINIISSHIQPTQQIQQQPKQTQKSGNTIAVLQNIPIQAQKLNLNKVSSPKGSIAMNKGGFNRPPASSASLSTVLTPGKSLLKDKERKMSQTPFSTQQFADDKMAGDDDINDVAAMGGVNLAEESQRILGSTELIGTQIRSCKDEYLLPTGVMQARLKAVTAKHGLDEPSSEVAGLISHAVHEHLKNLVEKLAVIAQHRIDLVTKTDPRYEVTQDVKGQLKFLEELDRVEKKRREDSEREMLLRAAKSRSKNEDPEQAKLKAKAKEMQRAELEELRQREANLTALQAIGPRKKPKLDGPGGAGDTASNGASHSVTGFSGRSQLALRTRLKRINQRDLVFLLEQERETAHSPMLYRCYLK